MHFLNTIDSICENLHKEIYKEMKNLNVSSIKSDTFYVEINFINDIMDRIDQSVNKKIELPDKEIVRRVLRLW